MVQAPEEEVLRAARAAEAAAARAHVRVEEVHGLPGEAAVSELFDLVWGTDGVPVMPANLLHALSHAGNYLAAAYDGERMVGAAFGFMGERHGEVFLHSHMTGVDPELQRRGVGFALKLHQRTWALSRNLPRIEWTFDPLVRHNSYFNLVKLGAEIIDYYENFYGEMPDGINAGDESDRVVVSWDLTSPRVAAACERGLPEPDLDRLRAEGAQIALDYDDEMRPVPSGGAGGPLLLCHIPKDVVSLRQTDPDAALTWRRALRDSLGTALQNGHRAVAITRSGWYVLEQRAAA
ncbi:MAG: GNAT family N-acetyltransferase [Actinomycetota bacterium]